MRSPDVSRAGVWMFVLSVLVIGLTLVAAVTWIRHVENTQHEIERSAERDRMSLTVVCHRQDAVIATLALLTAPARQALVTNPSIDPATLHAIAESNLAIRRAVRTIAATPCAPSPPER